MRTFVDHTPRIAVVGYGRWGRQCHTYLINLTEGLELRCVVSSGGEKRKKAEHDRHCMTYETFDQAINDPLVDAVVPVRLRRAASSLRNSTAVDPLLLP